MLLIGLASSSDSESKGRGTPFLLTFLTIVGVVSAQAMRDAFGVTRREEDARGASFAFCFVAVVGFEVFVFLLAVFSLAVFPVFGLATTVSMPVPVRIVAGLMVFIRIFVYQR
jgi:uncharacterized membrane protein YeaQ/YmgE (transglycosylase-associated protein family)